MSHSKWLVILVWLVFAVQPGFADDSAKVIGIWKLLSYDAESEATGAKEPVMGQNPTGYAIFAPEGRVMFVLTGEGRKAPKTIQDRAELLNTLIAYTGTYRVEGDTWITKVDVAWNPEWVGTEQKRSFTLVGDRLQVVTPPGVRPNWPEKGIMRSRLTFERVK
jgi:hypothetical protein